MKYEYTIYTRVVTSRRPNDWDCMLSGFDSSYSALCWLMKTYLENADFWRDIEVRVIREDMK